MIATQSPENPLEHWLGAFGKEYMERNTLTPEFEAEATLVFNRILDQSGIRGEVDSVLEVGANVGIKLTAMRNALGPDAQLTAVEPNPFACEHLRNSALNLADVVQADAYRLPFPDDHFDLVMTNGVLIHIPPSFLPTALREIARVARKFVFCSEYFSHDPVEIPYRGQSGMLWKRDFGKAFLETCPSSLTPHAYGFLWEVELPHFDNQNWWVLKKN